jgi:hypothetical protein
MVTDMLSAARRDPNFRGIDPAALAQLVKQATAAGAAIRGWLGSHQPPPGVSGAGYTAAADVERWLSGQLGMLSRRYNFAVTHPDTGGSVPLPPPIHRLGKTTKTTPRPTHGMRKIHRITPSGAGPGLGSYPTTGAAVKAAKADALAIVKAEKDHTKIPATVWHHLTADAKDPDYTTALYQRLGPKGTAELIAAAGHDQARLHVISQSLGTASHHTTFDKKWLEALLAESATLHDRATAITVLNGAHLTGRSATYWHQVIHPAPPERED